MRIFQYVLDNLDEDGRFTSSVLPDSPLETVPKELGTDDAAVYTMNMPANKEDAALLTRLLRAYLQEPLLPNRQRLYKALNKMNMAEYCDPFMSSFDQENIGEELYDLARRFFYNAKDREPVKFALLLFGLYGMQRIHDEDNALWRDLVTMAHCEEFTFAFLYGCRLRDYLPHKEIWELLGCTHGWGKVFSIIDCKCTLDAERLWLLKNGPDVGVEYPPLAVKLIRETHLERFLAEEMSFVMYKSAVAIIGNYLILLSHYSQEEITESFNLAAIDLPNLLHLLLKQAEKHAAAAEDVLDIVSLSISLRRLADEQLLSQLDYNQCQLFIAACDKIIYRQDWQADIDTRLIENGQVNYQLCDLAYGLEIDVWPQLYAYWQKHLAEEDLLPFLLSFNDERSSRVLQILEANISLYITEQNSLLVPLRYLQLRPGQGEIIICAALTSIYDFPRGIACGILDEWEPQYITPAIREALFTARNLSNNFIVSARIAALLQGRKFSLKKLLNEK